MIDKPNLFSTSFITAIEQFSSEYSITSLSSHQLKESDYSIISPDTTIVLIHLHRCEQDLFEIGSTIIKRFPSIPLIFLTSLDLPYFRYRAKKIGAHGYVDTSLSLEKLTSLFNRAVSGQQGQIHADKPLLTAKEIEIIEMVSRGFIHYDIADTLEISKRTVESHLLRIYSKLEVTCSNQAVMKAAQLGYITVYL